jgi:hypothetical protein
MNVIEKSRVLRFSTRKETSTSYRVKTEQVGGNDVLQLTISEEKDPGRVLGVFEFAGTELTDRTSIHFDARRVDGRWRLRFSGPRPTAVLFV